MWPLTGPTCPRREFDLVEKIHRRGTDHACSFFIGRSMTISLDDHHGCAIRLSHQQPRCSCQPISHRKDRGREQLPLIKTETYCRHLSLSALLNPASSFSRRNSPQAERSAH